MLKAYEASTADEVWQKVAHDFRTGKFATGQHSRAGQTSELLHTTITLTNPRQRWIPSRKPALNVAFALAEVVWILRGRNDAAFVNQFNSQLSKYAGWGTTYHGAYGHRLRKHFGFDQLERAYLVLKNNPDSRQVALQIWDASKDFPDAQGHAVAEDIPCNISSLLKVREGRLEWLQVMRSNDVFRGLPYNIVQFSSLHEIMAGWLNLEMGPYHHISDSLHVYDNTADDIQRSLPTSCEPSGDNLALPHEESEAIFRILENLVVQMIEVSVPVESLIPTLDLLEPQSYRNIGLILYAEGARRRNKPKAVKWAVSECTNPAYTQLYSAWLARTGFEA